MFLKCECGHTSPAGVLECEACGADLRYADVVYRPSAPESDEESVSNHGHSSVAPNSPIAAGNGGLDATGGSDYCQCTYCLQCEKPRRLNAEASTGESAQTPHREMYLVLPGAQHIPLGAGLLLGRDARAVNPNIASTLAPHKGVSGRHVWLAAERDAILVLDLGSRNGTWMQADRLAPHALHWVPLSKLPLELWLGGKLTVTVECREVA